MANNAQKHEQRRIILTKEQEAKIADQAQAHVQRYTNELSQVQARRVDLFSLILSAAVQNKGTLSNAEVDRCHEIATYAVELDSRQKWTDLKEMLREQGVSGPQPHLEWAARKVGVDLFDAPSPIIAAPVLVTEGGDIRETH